MTIKLSVIMAVFNGETFLGAAIKSILDQTFGDFELIIVDDGSTDGSIDIIGTFADSRIRLIRNRTNQGLAQSLNKGIDQARGMYIARFDADDISLPNRFEQQVMFLDSRPDIWIVGTDVLLIDSQGYLLDDFRPPPLPLKPAFIQWALFTRCCLYHPTVMMRKSAFEKLHGYNASLRYAQDYDLWLRAGALPVIANLGEVLVMIRRHKNNTTSRHILKQKDIGVRAVQQAIRTRFRFHAGCADIFFLQNRNRIRTSQQATRAMALAHRLTENFSQKRNESAFHRMWAHFQEAALIGDIALKLGKKDALHLFALLRNLMALKSWEIFYIPFCLLTSKVLGAIHSFRMSRRRWLVHTEYGRTVELGCQK